MQLHNLCVCTQIPYQLCVVVTEHLSFEPSDSYKYAAKIVEQEVARGRSYLHHTQ